MRYRARPGRVVLGAGSLSQVAAEVEALGLRRVLVICTPRGRGLAERVAGTLGDAGVFDGARQHVPADTVAAATRACEDLGGVDGYVSIGGGSTVGLAKALALSTHAPVVAVPTTYAGSEMTSVWGVTTDGHKRTGRDEAVRPRTVVYDAELTLDLPVATSSASGVNALAHAVEALYAPDRCALTDALAEGSARLLASALPAVAADPTDVQARSRALEGAWLAGTCLGTTAMGLHHKLCHVLGGRLGLPHAQTHAVLLPHVAAFTLPAVPAAEDALRRALGAADAADGLRTLTRRLGLPLTLAELGVTDADLPGVVGELLAEDPHAPRPVTRDGLRNLLHAATHGA